MQAMCGHNARLTKTARLNSKEMKMPFLKLMWTGCLLGKDISAIMHNQEPCRHIKNIGMRWTICMELANKEAKGFWGSMGP